jgi:hypothetical protein
MGSLLIAGALALLVIYAGIILLIQVKREALGNPYRIAAWGLIIAGKLLLILIAVGCVVACLRFGMKMRKGRMKQGYENYEGMGYHHKMHAKMMHDMGGMDGMGSHPMGGMGSCKMDGTCGMQNHCKMNGVEGGKDCCANMMMNCAADSVKKKR